MLRARGATWGLLCVAACAGACSSDGSPVFAGVPVDPELAELALIDRFSADAAVILVRTDDNGVPGPGEPVDFDQPPFLLKGLGPDGQRIGVYNFDVKSETPGKWYVFSRDGQPMVEQLPVLSRLPGELGYSDLVRVHEVSAPAGYLANAITSEAELFASKFLVTPTDTILNRVVVPAGSSASLRHSGGDTALRRAWHGGGIAHFFSFEDDVPSISIGYGEAAVRISTIWLTFNINADMPGGGLGAGMMTEAGTDQTHSVTQALPGDVRYSPLWMAIIYDNASFADVVDSASAERAPVVAGIPSPFLNWPIVSVDRP